MDVMRRALTAVVLLSVLILCDVPRVYGADPQPYKVDMASTPDSALNSTLKATSELMTLRTSAPVGPYGLIGRARGDLDRLKTVLESFGYYQSYVGITIDGLPLDDPGVGEELTARTKDNDSRIKITYSLGALYHLRKIDIDGDVPKGATGALGLSTGAPAVASDVLAAGDRLVTALQDQGYAFAKVDTPTAYEDPPNRVLDVRFHVVTGQRVKIGDIRVRGLKRIKESVVRKRLLVHTGEQYGATRIETARKDLLALGVFSSVSVRVGTKPDSEGRVPLTFQIRERLQHAVSVSGAYSSDLGGSTGVTWTDRNVSGGGDSLTLAASALNLGGGTASNGIGYDTSAKYVIPDFHRRDQSLQVSLEALSQSLVSYDQKALTAGLAFNRKLSNIWSAGVGFNVETERIVQQECVPLPASNDLADFTQYCNPAANTVCQLVPLSLFTPPQCVSQTFHYTLLYLPISATYNTTGLGSPLEDAVKGLRITLTVTPTLSIGRPNTRFFITQASVSTYLDLQKLGLNQNPGRSVLAFRALAGVAAGASEFSLPPDQRFYAGGSGTIRGYRYQSVGPVFPDGNPVGGTAIQAGSMEYRQRLGMSFGTAVFVDAGQVSKNLNILNSTMRFGTGAGVRYYTPIGPIRVDIAVPINKRPRTATFPGDDSFEVYIGLGQAF
ncbi:MAG TPA: BamA/TamA family outer membrane protein [Steroidobacteraceae bacterium]